MQSIPPDRMPDGFDEVRRHVRLKGMIDRHSVGQVLLQLLYLRHVSCERTITLEIDSTGGMVGDSLVLHDFLIQPQNRIATHCSGIAEGTAVLLLGAGMRKCRTAVKSATIRLISVIDLDRTGDVDAVMRADYMVADLLASYTGKTAAELITLMHLRKSFSADESLKFGLIDRIAEEADPNFA